MRHTSRSPKARPEIETYIVPDGTCFLFDPTRDQGFALDQLGALVWDYCDGQTRQEDILADIAALLPEQPIMADRVAELLTTFAMQGLLEPEAADPVTGAAVCEPREEAT